jgi:hypothetical protein
MLLDLGASQQWGSFSVKIYLGIRALKKYLNLKLVGSYKCGNMVEWNLKTLIKNTKISKEGSNNILELQMSNNVHSWSGCSSKSKIQIINLAQKNYNKCWTFVSKMSMISRTHTQVTFM